jgi:MOSC domain-containing protein YiiM
MRVADRSRRFGGILKLISLNVARPRLVRYGGQTFNTGIFKEPVDGPVPLRTLNLDGDRQADLSVHGGPYKAVYAYPSEHYPYWRNELPGTDLPWGMFGENFTTENPHALLQTRSEIPA